MDNHPCVEAIKVLHPSKGLARKARLRLTALAQAVRKNRDYNHHLELTQIIEALENVEMLIDDYFVDHPIALQIFSKLPLRKGQQK